jgi:hypothetical protein
MKQKELQALIGKAAESGFERERLSKIASAYPPNDEYDRLIAIRVSDWARYDSMVTQTLRISVGYYEATKTAHDAIANLERTNR